MGGGHFFKIVLNLFISSFFGCPKIFLEGSPKKLFSGVHFFLLLFWSKRNIFKCAHNFFWIWGKKKRKEIGGWGGGLKKIGVGRGD